MAKRTTVPVDVKTTSRPKRATVQKDPVPDRKIETMVQDLKKVTTKTQSQAQGRGGTVRIANQHSADFLFPRKSGGISLPPLSLRAQTISDPIDKEVWTELKKMPVVRHWLDRGLLAEVNREGKVQLLDSTSTDLEVPEHLQDDEAEGQNEGGLLIKAKVKTTGVGSVTLENK